MTGCACWCPTTSCEPPRDLRRAAWEGLRLIRKVKGELKVVARVRAISGDPAALFEQVARMLLRQRMTEGQLLAGTVLVLGIADGFVTRRSEASRHVLDVLADMGFLDPDGLPLDDRWFDALTAPVMEVLSTLGLWTVGPAHRRVLPSAALRQLARLALR